MQQGKKTNNMNDISGVVNIWSPLDKLHAIEQDIKNLLTQHEGLSYNDMADGFEAIKAQLTIWMENAHLTIFTLEQKAKEGATMSSSDLASLQTKMAEMEGLMGHFGDISELMDEKFDDTTSNMEKMDDTDGSTSSTMALAAKRMAFKMGITKLQSEWSGLHHFMVSVTKQVESANEKQELLVMMENIILDIDNLTSTIFEYQEKRYLGLAVTTTNTGSATMTSSTNDTPSVQHTNTTTKANGDTSPKDESILADLDQRVKPVFFNVEKVYARMNSTTRSLDGDSGILVRKHRLVQEKWECLRIEIDELKDELKEDRWLSVFRQVADQVDTMINAVQDCYSTIQQIIDWHELVQQVNYSGINSNNDPSSPHSSSTFDKLSKTFMRSFPKSHQSSASVTSTSSTSSSTIQPPPFDLKKLRLVEKNFEAKYTYYTPSIDRMLEMLGNGIASRKTKDDSTCKRQSAMLSRWEQLKATMDDLRVRDLANAEKYLMEPPYSPASSIQSDKSHHGIWKSIRRRTSNQDNINTADNNTKIRSASTINGLTRINSPAFQHDEHRRVRSYDRYKQSTKAYNRQQRTTSPPSAYQHRNMRPRSGSPILRPTFNGRKSLTPSRPAWTTSIKPDKPEFSSVEPLWKGESRAIASASEDDSSLTRHAQARKSLVPRPPSAQHHTKEASFMKPTKSTMLRKRSQSVEPPDISRPKTPTRTKVQPATIGSNTGRRTKTPASIQLYHHIPPRPRSSLARQESHNLLPYMDRERAPSPTRRTRTPSLIPRPKTPTFAQKDFLRSTSPSLIPRPRSSLRMYQQGNQNIPPVPPIPNNLERPSIHLLKDIYEEAERDDCSSSPLSPCTFPDSSLSIPSIFDSNDTSPLYQQQHYIDKPRSSIIPSHSGINTNTNNTNVSSSNPQKRRELLKKRSMPALAIQRSGSPFQSSPKTPTIRTTTPGSFSRLDDLEEDGVSTPHDATHPIYTGDPRDPLDMEIATILNSSPISPQGVGKYYFGNELNPTLGGGKKLYTCKRQHGGNKVLVRVGGGWTELSQFLLDHALFL
ncbi:hypothetical protein BC941DRAFT_411414 [Chlamydoabsidia padenii]|nr:hypothetical protein BC941DRAFT_411414 [Chlamydoabsidia padenii]